MLAGPQPIRAILAWKLSGMSSGGGRSGFRTWGIPILLKTWNEKRRNDILRRRKQNISSIRLTGQEEVHMDLTFMVVTLDKGQSPEWAGVLMWGAFQKRNTTLICDIWHERNWPAEIEQNYYSQSLNPLVLIEMEDWCFWRWVCVEPCYHTCSYCSYDSLHHNCIYKGTSDTVWSLFLCGCYDNGTLINYAQLQNVSWIAWISDK